MPRPDYTPWSDMGSTRRQAKFATVEKVSTALTPKNKTFMGRIRGILTNKKDSDDGLEIEFKADLLSDHFKTISVENIIAEINKDRFSNVTLDKKYDRTQQLEFYYDANNALLAVKHEDGGLKLKERVKIELTHDGRSIFYRKEGFVTNEDQENKNAAIKGWTTALRVVRNRSAFFINMNGIEMVICLDILVRNGKEILHQCEIELAKGSREKFPNMVDIIAHHMKIPASCATSEKGDVILRHNGLTIGAANG